MDTMGSGEALRVNVWYCFTVEVIAVTTRLSLKGLHNIKSLAWDDVVCVAGLLSSLAASIATDLAARNGLDANLGPVTESSHAYMQMCIYIAQLCHVLCLSLVKLSVVIFVENIFGQKLYRHSTTCLGCFVLIWGLVSLFIVSFQCPTPHTWDLSQNACFNMAAFWTYFGIMDIVTDATIVSIPVAVTLNIQMTLEKKGILIGCFVPWIGAMVTAAVGAAYAKGFRPVEDLREFSTLVFPWFMCAQVSRAVSIVCTCVPYIRRFVEALPSGMLQSDEIRRRGLTMRDITYGYTQEVAAGGSMYYLHDLEDSTIKSEARKQSTASLGLRSASLSLSLFKSHSRNKGEHQGQDHRESEEP